MTDSERQLWENAKQGTLLKLKKCLDIQNHHDRGIYWDSEKCLFCIVSCSIQTERFILGVRPECLPCPIKNLCAFWTRDEDSFEDNGLKYYIRELENLVIE